MQQSYIKSTMKIQKLISVASALLILFVFSSCTPQKEEHKELKVMVWNIWHAGHSKNYPQKGCEGTIGIIKKSGADVILMIETYGAAPMIADSLGYSYELISNNLCIFSRYPITKTYTFPDKIATFNFGGVEINVDGTPVRLFDTWLHYLPDLRLAPTNKPEAEILAWDNEGSRDEEINAILSTLKPILSEADSIPVILGGDFNSHSHLDWTEATKNLYNHGGAVVNWTVSKTMQEARFKDSFRELNPDPVQNIGTSWLYEVSKEEGGIELPTRSDRIDFIYYQGNTIKAIDSEIYNAEVGNILSFKDETFFYASDHGFVLTTFQLNARK